MSISTVFYSLQYVRVAGAGFGLTSCCNSQAFSKGLATCQVLHVQLGTDRSSTKCAPSQSDRGPDLQETFTIED